MPVSEGVKTDTGASLLAPESLLSALPLPAALIGAGRRVTLANGPARNAFGEVQPGQDLAIWIRNPALLDAVDTVLSSEDRAVCEIRTTGTPAAIYEVSLAAFDFGGVRHAMALFVEKTMVRQAEAARSAFVANVSHELRSPLTTLMGAVEALEGPASNDAAGRERMLVLMRQEAQRMKNLIDDLLSLSRVEAQEFIPPGRAASLPPLLEGARERLSERAATRGMTIALDLESGLPGAVGVEDELFQVFDNLIGNAIKYGKEESIVTVRARKEGEGVSVSVHNEGPPIPPEHLPRLTERFYRVDKSRSRELGGTGLGLAIVKHIVNRHRGRLNVESSEEAGTVFTVVLPASH